MSCYFIRFIVFMKKLGLKEIRSLVHPSLCNGTQQAGIRAQLSLIAKTTLFCRLCGSVHTRYLVSLILLISPLNMTHYYTEAVLGFALLSSLALLILPHKQCLRKFLEAPLDLHICACISISIIFLSISVLIYLCSSIHLSIQPSIFFIYRSIHPTIYSPWLPTWSFLCFSIHSSIHPFPSVCLFSILAIWSNTESHSTQASKSDSKNDCSADSGTHQSETLGHEPVAHGSHLLMISKHRLTQPGV